MGMALQQLKRLEEVCISIFVTTLLHFVFLQYAAISSETNQGAFYLLLLHYLHSRNAAEPNHC